MLFWGVGIKGKSGGCKGSQGLVWKGVRGGGGLVKKLWTNDTSLWANLELIGPKASLRPAGPRWIIGRVQFLRVNFSCLAFAHSALSSEGKILYLTLLALVSPRNWAKNPCFAIRTPQNQLKDWYLFGKRLLFPFNNFARSWPEHCLRQKWFFWSQKSEGNLEARGKYWGQRG